MLNAALKKANVSSQFIIAPGGQHAPGVMGRKILQGDG